jgi:transposase
MTPDPNSAESCVQASAPLAGRKTGTVQEPELVTATQQELDDILSRCRTALTPQQFHLLKGVLDTFVYLTLKLQNARVSLGRLKKLLFGPRTERLRDVAEDARLASAPPDSAAPGDRAAAVEAAEPTAEAAAAPATSVAVVTRRRKGHGRNGADAYRGAEVVDCMHGELAGGQRCPQCGRGRIYDWVPRTLVRVTGQAPLAATVYRLEQLRCRLCDAVFTAPAPAGVIEAPKYDASCASMLALLRYGSGVPFYRLEGLQASLQVPLPDATQWEIVSQAAAAPQRVVDELVRLAAQARLLHNDDTPMRVLELMAARRAAEGRGEDGPKAIQTTGIVAEVDARRVVLFFTGHAHAGQNLQALLAKRAQELGPPLQMCDALAANVSGELATVVCNCLAHGRRKVIDVLEHFPAQGLHIIEQLAQVYGHDAHCREHAFTDAQRLAWHQRNSAPVMTGLHEWMTARLTLREVEPNSGLGEAIRYLLKHWEALTQFLHREGAPLDNTACERALKRAIVHRKNSLFFKTGKGAQVGDVYMSLIATCVAGGINAFDYLQALHLHAERVKANAALWLPWNYQLQLTPGPEPVPA